MSEPLGHDQTPGRLPWGTPEEFRSQPTGSCVSTSVGRREGLGIPICDVRPGDPVIIRGRVVSVMDDVAVVEICQTSPLGQRARVECDAVERDTTAAPEDTGRQGLERLDRNASTLATRVADMLTTRGVPAQLTEDSDPDYASLVVRDHPTLRFTVVLGQFWSCEEPVHVTAGSPAKLRDWIESPYSPARPVDSPLEIVPATAAVAEVVEAIEKHLGRRQ